MHKKFARGDAIMRDPIEYKGLLYDRMALVEYIDETGKDIY